MPAKEIKYWKTCGFAPVQNSFNGSANTLGKLKSSA